MRWCGGILCAGAAALCAMLAGSGCASTPPEPTPVAGAFAGNQGGAWEAVFAPAMTAPSPAGDEYARRDEALAVSEPASILATGLWPDPYQPSLDDARQLLLINRPDFVTYYSQYSGYWYGRAYWGRRGYYWP